ncbi:RidA family protein [Embleya sp. NBC_00896]|uniref:RidA family protein n=1 Tax=Embleya sp. NBC_00896 TaxID=2975961 RepID=UPI002F90DC9C|nr:RidA family protein [Embleya sp. NBC_00896]
MTKNRRLTRISSPAGVSPANGYSQVVTGPGRLVVISGQVATDEHGEPVGEGDPDAQARQVFTNLGRCLAAAGATFDDVVKLTHFTTDITYLKSIGAAWDEFIDPEHEPASSTVQVGALFRPEFLVEVEAFALVAPSDD